MSLLRKQHRRLQQVPDEPRHLEFINNAEEGFWIIDANAITVYVNQKIADMLGYQCQEMIGRPLFNFIDQEHVKDSHDYLARRRHGIRETHDSILRRKDGTKVWTTVAANPVYNEKGEYSGSIGFISDISKRRQNEILLSAQRDIFEKLVQGVSLKDALDPLVCAMESIMSEALVSIHVMDDEGKHLFTGAAPHLPESFNLAIHGATIGPNAGSCGTSAFEKRIVIVTDTYTDPLWANYRELAKAHRFRACWSSPILSNEGKTLGTFAVYFHEVRTPTEGELQLIHDATAATALSIQYVKTKESLAKTASLLNAAIESSADGILVVGTDGAIQNYNLKFIQMWGIPDKILASGKYSQIVAFKVRQVIEPRAFLSNLRNLSQKLQLESSDTIYLKNGKIFEIYSIPQRINDQVVGRVWTSRDVTQQKKLENDVKTSEERFRALSEATFEAVLIHDRTRLMLANQSASRLYGYLPSELIGLEGLQLVSPEFRPDVRKHLYDSIPYEIKGLKKDGTTFWAEARGGSIQFRGVPARVASVRDISDRKKAEEKLRQSEENFRATFELSAVGNAQIDPKNRKITQANKRFCEITGYSLEELRQKDFLELSPPEDQEKELPLLLKLLNGEVDSQFIEKRIIRKDQRIVWVEATKSPIRNSEGTVINTICVLQDVTGRKEAELIRAQFLEREKRARKKATFLAEAGKVLASSLDFELTLKNVSQLIVSYLADWCFLILLKDEREGKTVTAHADPSKTSLIQKLQDYRPDLNAPEGLSKAIRTRMPLLYSNITEDQLTPGPNGWPMIGTRDPYYLDLIRALGLKSYMAIPMIVRDKPIGAIFIACAKSEGSFDQDDLELANELGRSCATAIDNASLYQEAQRAIEVRNNFISIASHEFRTPLTPLKLQLQLVNKQIRAADQLGTNESQSLKKLLLDSERQVEKMIVLVENLLDISKISAGQLTISIQKNVDLKKIVDKVIDQFTPELEKAHCCLTVRAYPILKGNWDPLRIEQIISHLLSNALKYGKGMPIEVKIEESGPNAILKIADQGVGIDQKDQPKLFAPFERAAPLTSFGGFGLGLFITRQIIESHGGTIEVTSEPGKGSCFTVKLPYSGPPKKME